MENWNFTWVHFQVGGALLPFFFLLVLKPHVLPFFLRPTAPLGVLFRAESVGASLEAPVAPPAPTENQRETVGFRLVFTRLLWIGFTGASSDAPTNFAFMLFFCG